MDKTTKEIIQNDVCGVLGFLGFWCMVLGYFAAMDGIVLIFLVGVLLSLLALLTAFLAELPTLVGKLIKPKTKERKRLPPSRPFWRTSGRRLIRRHSWQKWIERM